MNPTGGLTALVSDPDLSSQSVLKKGVTSHGADLSVQGLLLDIDKFASRHGPGRHPSAHDCVDSPSPQGYAGPRSKAEARFERGPFLSLAKGDEEDDPARFLVLTLALVNHLFVVGEAFTPELRNRQAITGNPVPGRWWFKFNSTISCHFLRRQDITCLVK